MLVFKCPNVSQCNTRVQTRETSEAVKKDERMCVSPSADALMTRLGGGGLEYAAKRSRRGYMLTLGERKQGNCFSRPTLVSWYRVTFEFCSFVDIILLQFFLVRPPSGMYVMYSSKIKMTGIQFMMHDNCQHKKKLKKSYGESGKNMIQYGDLKFLHKNHQRKKLLSGFTLSENRDNQNTHVKPVPPFKNSSFFGETLGAGTAHLKGLYVFYTNMTLQQTQNNVWLDASFFVDELKSYHGKHDFSCCCLTRFRNNDTWHSGSKITIIS